MTRPAQRVTIDGIQYRVTPREGALPLVYKRYPTGAYFRWSLIWGSPGAGGGNRIPKIGSTVARVLAAAGNV